MTSISPGRYGIPRYMHEGIANYLERGIPPGSFLRAVLENNLVEAARRADNKNKYLLHRYAALLYNLPTDCWGSEEIVKEYMREKRKATT